MKNLTAIQMLLCAVVAGVSCRQAEVGDSTSQIQPPRWTFQLQISPPLSLLDDDQKSAENLHEQLRKIRNNGFSFGDPVVRRPGFSEPSGSGIKASFHGQFGGVQRFEYLWSISTQNKEANRFAACSTKGGDARNYLSCESKALYECLYRESLAAKTSDSQESRSSADKSLLMNWARSCGLEGSFENVFDQDASFKISDGRAFFSPSPLLAVLIYKGAWSSYEVASVEAAASATFPQVVPCERADGSCLRSPASVTQCLGCNGLEAGKIYTVFFLEGLRQDYSSVRSVLYVP